MKLVLKGIVAMVGVLFVAAIVMPALCRRGGIYFGSYEYARQWATELKACDSLDDVKQRFNCIRYEPFDAGAYRTVTVSDVDKKHPSALMQAFADGGWIACAYADSHGNKAGGTLVARASAGQNARRGLHRAGGLSGRGLAYARGPDRSECFVADVWRADAVEGEAYFASTIAHLVRGDQGLTSSGQE